MKICYIGGGNIRIIREIRELLKLEQARRDGSEIALFDIALDRAETIASLARQTPEFRHCGNAVVTCHDNIESAVAGADFVVMIARPGGARNDIHGRRIAVDSGFIGTDNLSLNGAFLALDAVPVVVNVARKMEVLAPTGIMLVFTNPITILVNAVNTYTKIKAFGICAGQVNHCYDIPLLMRWRQPRFSMQVEAAGINHLSFFQKLTLDGKDLLSELRGRTEGEINLDHLKDKPALYESVKFTLPRILYAWNRLDALVFSSEGDGLAHLCFHDAMVEFLRERYRQEANSPEQAAMQQNGTRQKQYQELAALAASPEQGEEFWNSNKLPWAAYPLPAYKHACGVQAIDGLSSDKDVEMVLTCRNDDSAIEDFPEHLAMEYSVRLNTGKATRKNRYRLPAAAREVVRALAEYQYMVASAIVEESRTKFIQGLYIYPMCRDMARFKVFWDKMIRFKADGLPDFLRD